MHPKKQLEGARSVAGKMEAGGGMLGARDSCQLSALLLVLNVSWSQCRRMKRRGTVKGGQEGLWLISHFSEDASCC